MQIQYVHILVNFRDTMGFVASEQKDVARLKFIGNVPHPIGAPTRKKDRDLAFRVVMLPIFTALRGEQRVVGTKDHVVIIIAQGVGLTSHTKAPFL
jgi:hypothetical protein